MIQKRTKLPDMETKNIVKQEVPEVVTKIVEVPVKPVFSSFNGKVKRKFSILTISKALLDEMSAMFPGVKAQQLIEAAMLFSIKCSGNEAFDRVKAKIAEGGGEIR